MDLHGLPIAGTYEDNDAVRENLRIAVPDNYDERTRIAAAILAEPEIVDDDIARQGYTFEYQLGGHLGNGIWALPVFATDESGRRHGMEIAAALVITGASERSIESGVAMWFINNRLRYEVLEGDPREYAGVAYGRLNFPDSEVLPHRWLFGAKVPPSSAKQ